ncbi:MAG TPA: recombinase family protein [Roseiarcus sp.]
MVVRLSPDREEGSETLPTEWRFHLCISPGIPARLSLAARNAARSSPAPCFQIAREARSGWWRWRLHPSERRELARALKAIAAGDTLLVTRLDRLARSTRDLLNIVDAVAKAGAGFRSLADAWADTTTPHGRLMLTVLGGLAEFERELIRARTGDGRKRARARGVHMGRPPKLTKHQQREAMAALAEGSATQADLARRFNVSQATISRLAR